MNNFNFTKNTNVPLKYLKYFKTYIKDFFHEYLIVFEKKEGRFVLICKLFLMFCLKKRIHNKNLIIYIAMFIK